MEKCIFKDAACIYGYNDSHDDCRRCRNVPNMDIESGIEKRLLCSVAGKRELQKKYFGSIGDEYPSWFEDIIKQTGYLEPRLSNCLDHKRILGGKAVVGEPYNLNISDFKDLISFCEEHNLTFTIDGMSAHFPGRCFRVIIAKRRG